MAAVRQVAVVTLLQRSPSLSCASIGRRSVTQNVRIHAAYRAHLTRKSIGAKGQVLAIAAPSSAPVSSPDSERLLPKQPRFGAGGIIVEGHRVTSPRAWEHMYAALVANKVRTVAPQELTFALRRGAVVVDVRVAEVFRKSHIPGAINVPAYRQITGWTPWKVLRRAGFAFFAVFNATEPNTEFSNQLVEAVGGDRGAEVFLLCDSKGDLSQPPPANNGELWHNVYQSRASFFVSRSLIAAYLATAEGFTSVSVLRTGFKEWQADGRPTASSPTA